MNEKQQRFWKTFKEQNPDFRQATFGSAWCFGDSKEMADQLAELVLQGKKTATASAFLCYELENEQLPEANKYVLDILLNGSDEPVAILETTNVYVTPFDQVSKEHAYKEGEGDRTLDYWRKVHFDFWSKSLESESIKEVNLKKMKVVCEEFKVIWMNR